jgi:hypothetical protein
MAENMGIAGRECGLDSHVAIQADAEVAAVTVTFSPAASSGDPLYPAIRLRCTNRKPFQRQPLAEGVLDRLSAAIGADGRAELQWIEAPAAMKTIAKAAAQNDRLLFEWRQLHDTFYESMRWSEAEAQATRDGLFIKTLELGPMAPGFKAMRHWPVAAAASALGSSRLAPGHSYRTFLRSAAFGFLQMAERTPADFIEGGRRLQRVWLTATTEGLGFQPMAGMLYLTERLRETGSDALPPAHRDLVNRARGLLGSALSLSAGKSPILIYSVGEGPAATATSLRRAVVF